VTIGSAADARPAPLPARVILEGRDIVVVRLDPAAQSDALFESIAGSEHDDLWTLLFDVVFYDPGRRR
jgi:hypothetical protein